MHVTFTCDHLVLDRIKKNRKKLFFPTCSAVSFDSRLQGVEMEMDDENSSLEE